MDSDMRALPDYAVDGLDIGDHVCGGGCGICAMERELAEAKQQILAYQIAKDNLELRLAKREWDYDQDSAMAADHFNPAQVY